MKKLIETTEQSVIVCDNPECDFEIPYDPANKRELISFIDVACPKCGENLLTVEDYLRHEQIMKIVRWINRWFSWLTLFTSGKRSAATVYTHNGIDIKINDPELTKNVEE